MKKENKIKEKPHKEDKIKKEKKIKEKSQKENKTKKATKEKVEKTNKFLEIIKKKWLIDGTKSFILVAAIVAVFIAITLVMQNLELTPIDLTADKIFTLTEESKETVKNIGDSKVNIYFIGFTEDDSTLDLAKQYTKANENIKVEAVTTTDRPDLAEKYGIDSSSQGILVENGERYKVLASSDLYTYDYETYETISIAEEKLTAAIKSVTTDKIPNVYFLTGYSDFSLTTGMQYLNMLLQNEINDVKTLDILSAGSVPEDCNVLVITSPNKDFDEIATNSIIDYINKGGNLLWLNAAVVNEVNYPNVNKVLAMYGINPFSLGLIRETTASKMVSNSPDLIMPEIQYSDVTEKLVDTEGVIFINATKINVISEEELSNLKVTKTDLIKTSDGAYFRNDLSIMEDGPQEGETKEAMLVGAQFDKIIVEGNEETGEKELTSKLIIYGENFFISDYQLTQSSYTPIISYRQNKDLALNSIAYLVDREEDITVRKSTGSVTYTATEQENRIILGIITAVPLAIIIVGIVVWRIRRRKNK